MDILSPSEITAVWILDKSVETWDNIAFTRIASGIRLNETTITQNLVLDFWRAAEERIFPISIFEAMNEKANGNDLELLIETDSGYLKMALQAKSIKTNDRYSTLIHKAKNAYYSQIDLLIQYARKHGAIPLYLFYNYIDNGDAITNVCNHQGINSIKYTGMSVAKASEIKNAYLDSKTGKWKIPDFEHLHLNHAIPFFFLFLEDEFHLENLVSHKDNNIKIYSLEEIMNDDDWNMLAGPATMNGIMFENSIADDVIEQRQTVKVFDPKFRIVISKNTQGRLYVMS